MKNFSNLKRFLIQLLMLGRVTDFLFLQKWDTLRNSIPGFKDACDQLKNYYTALNQKYTDYKKFIKGIALAKRQAKISLAMAGFTQMNNVRSYAVKNNLINLAASMDVNQSDLIKLKDQDLIAAMNSAIGTVQPFVPIDAFNVTEENFADWQAKVTAFQNLLTGPDSAHKQKTAIGANLVIDMKTTMDFFDNQLTPLASNFMNNNDFYLNFLIEKKIGIPSRIHSKLHATCVSELGVPYFGLIVTVDTYTDPKTGKTYESYSSVTDASGKCEVSGFFPGTRTVTISGSSVIAKTFPAKTFKRSKTVEQEFVLQPSQFNIPAPQQSKQEIKSN